MFAGRPEIVGGKMNISTDAITIYKDGGYMLVQSFNGDYCPEFGSAIHKLSKLSSEHGITKVIVDTRKGTHHSSLNEQLKDGEYLLECTQGELQFAILLPTVKNRSGSENVSVDRGGQLRFFTSEEHAKEWLGVQV